MPVCVSVVGIVEVAAPPGDGLPVRKKGQGEAVGDQHKATSSSHVRPVRSNRRTREEAMQFAQSCVCPTRDKRARIAKHRMRSEGRAASTDRRDLSTPGGVEQICWNGKDVREEHERFQAAQASRPSSVQAHEDRTLLLCRTTTGRRSQRRASEQCPSSASPAVGSKRSLAC